jgi:hypothetical protein
MSPPEQVVEIAFDGVHRSSGYPAVSRCGSRASTPVRNDETPDAIAAARALLANLRERGVCPGPNR